MEEIEIMEEMEEIGIIDTFDDVETESYDYGIGFSVEDYLPYEEDEESEEESSAALWGFGLLAAGVGMGIKWLYDKYGKPKVDKAKEKGKENFEALKKRREEKKLKKIKDKEEGSVEESTVEEGDDAKKKK